MRYVVTNATSPKPPLSFQPPRAQSIIRSLSHAHLARMAAVACVCAAAIVGKSSRASVVHRASVSRSNASRCVPMTRLTDRCASCVDSRRRPATHGGRRGVHGRRRGLAHHARPRVPRTAQSVSMRRDDVRVRRTVEGRRGRGGGGGRRRAEDAAEKETVPFPRALRQVS